MEGIEFLSSRRLMELKEGGLNVLRGIRRSGKTVYLKRLISRLIDKGTDPSKILYLSCDRLNKNQIRHIVSEVIIRKGGGYLFLDEVTYLDDWELLLKEVMENKGFTVVATGSNPVGIKHKMERLPGRGIEGSERYFNPLSFNEFVGSLIAARSRISRPDLVKALNALEGVEGTFSPEEPDVKSLMPFFEELERLFFVYLQTGGFPSALSDYVEHGEVRSSSYESLIRVIMGTLAKEGKSEETARAVLERLLTMGTTRFDYLSLASEIGQHHNTVHDYLELLEDARLIYVLQPWDIAKGRHSPRKQKKALFQSPLLAQALYVYLHGGGWQEAQAFLDLNAEWLVESTVASHVIWTKERPLMMEKHAFSGYYYAGSGSECDLVLSLDRGYFGIETKYGKLERAKYPFKTIYITKSELDEDAIPASLFLYGLRKSEWVI